MAAAPRRVRGRMHTRMHTRMRARAVCVLALGLVLEGAAHAAPALAQEAPRPDAVRDGGVPREVALALLDLWNAPATRRVRGDFTLAIGDTVRGDLAVLEGVARLAGTVTGEVAVINGDALLDPSATIGGRLTVVGGTLTLPRRDAVAGDLRAWRGRLRWVESDGVLALEPEDAAEARWRRWRRGDPGSYRAGEVFVTGAHTYNRVEGLPVYAGPRFRVRNGDTRTTVELLGVFRTGDRLAWTPENRGHRVHAEIRQGRTRGVSAGGRLFDEVDAVERWALSDGEAGLAAFLATRDFRDHWRRHGAAGYVALHADERSALTATLGTERWSSRVARDPWSLVDDAVPWRVNPAMDEGVLRLFTVAGTWDTRNAVKDPSTGWLLQATYERGSGQLDRIAPTTLPAVRDVSPGPVRYGRAWVDLRRYNRLAPWVQLNLRAVAGGWVHGDPLPLQRRLSVSGVDVLPGFDFRRVAGGGDACATGDDAAHAALGRPAQCERILLLQGEWRGRFRARPFGGDDSTLGDRRWTAGRVRLDGAWVLFANSGRGWLLDAPGIASGRDARTIPALGTWHTDLGGGLDLGRIGVYVAKAVSEPGLPANVFVRVRRRF